MGKKESEALDEQDARWDGIRAEAKSRKEKIDRGELVRAADLGLTGEMCEALGLDPGVEYPVDEAKKEYMKEQIEMLGTYAGLMSMKYLLACISLLLPPDKNLIRVAEFCTTFVMGQSPQRMLSKPSGGKWEMIMERTQEVMRTTEKVLITTGEIDGNGSKEKPV